MARTIKLKESDLTKIVRRISESKGLLTEKWVLKGWVKAAIGIGKALGWLVGAWGWSDSRLKKNIRRVGKSPSGIPIYEFEYKNKARFGGGTYRGVLAEHAPKKSVVIAENGYRKVDYSKIDVAFERVNPTKRKTIRLKESDLTNVIKRVINEKIALPDFDKLGRPGPYNPGNPFDDFDGFGDYGGFGGMSQGGGSDDPMAYGNEEMETDSRGGDEGRANEALAKIRPVAEALNIGNAELQSMSPRDFVSKEGGNHYDREMLATTEMLTGLLNKIVRELESTGNISPGTGEEIVAAKKKTPKWIMWIYKLFYKWEGDGPPTDPSDVRLKENVTRTGVSKSGIPTYTFNYKGYNELWSGTMAQDLLKMGRKDAVLTTESGYYGVNYDMIDVDMKVIR